MQTIGFSFVEEEASCSQHFWERQETARQIGAEIEKFREYINQLRENYSVPKHSFRSTSIRNDTSMAGPKVSEAWIGRGPRCS